MELVAILVVVVLLLLAAVHAYWGLGGRWPGNDDASMVGLVVARTKDMRAPGVAASFAVAAALGACAVLVAIGGGLLTAPEAFSGWVRMALLVATAVFLLRGVAGYVPRAFRYAEGTPFHRLNRVLYSPLCLVVGAALLMIVLEIDG